MNFPLSSDSYIPKILFYVLFFFVPKYFLIYHVSSFTHLLFRNVLVSIYLNFPNLIDLLISKFISLWLEIDLRGPRLENVSPRGGIEVASTMIECMAHSQAGGSNLNLSSFSV